MINYIQDQKSQCSDQSYILLGFSEGATVLINSLNDERFNDFEDDVEKVILFGNPYRNTGQSSNVDGFNTDDAIGYLTQSVGENNIDTSWDNSGKVSDYCIEDDCTCNINCNNFFDDGHYSYNDNNDVVSQATNDIVNAL